MRQLSMGFEKWQSTAAQLRAEGMAVRKALMRMVQSKLAAALSKLRESAADSKRQQRTVSGAIRRVKQPRFLLFMGGRGLGEDRIAPQISFDDISILLCIYNAFSVKELPSTHRCGSRLLPWASIGSQLRS